MNTTNIALPQMFTMYALLLLPLAIFISLRIPLKKQLLMSFVRMTIQLVLVGLYLTLIFEMNNLWLTLGWLVCMIVVADVTLLRSTKLPIGRFFALTFPGILFSSLGVLFFMIFFVVQPTQWYSAPYLVPLGGMLLGNSLQSLIISLQSYTTLLQKNKTDIYSALCMGSTLQEALRPYLRAALQSALTPAISGIATIGLVSLPGMMTGQMLGGSFPVVAIKYQIVIMIAIFTTQVVTATLNLALASPRFFDENHRII